MKFNLLNLLKLFTPTPYRSTRGVPGGHIVIDSDGAPLLEEPVPLPQAEAEKRARELGGTP